MQWTGFDPFRPRKSHLEQLNEKQRECAALQTEVDALRKELEHVKACLTSSYDCTWGSMEANPEHSCTYLCDNRAAWCVVRRLEEADK